MERSKKGSVFGGAMLVAGTAIGGGMLGLPVRTAAGGFFPATFVFLLCWLFMSATGLLFMEVFLWSKHEVNIISMAQKTLGRFGRIFAWLLYLYFFYSLTVAYISAGGNLVSDVAIAFGKQEFSHWLGPVIFVVFFAPFVCIGAKAVDRINLLLMAGLILSFLIFVVLGMGHVELNLLGRFSLPHAFLATPLAVASFGFQGIVPTLTNYLDRNPVRVRRAILIGSSIPLVTYVLWELLILGVVPIDQLQDALKVGQSAVYPLKNILEFPWLYRVGEFFAFFAIVTSFLGVTLGLLDFLADGLNVKKNVAGRLQLAFLVFLPPLTFAMINPCIFLYALHFAGGLGSAFLLGLLPILMVWRGRYQLNYPSAYALFGGKWMLSLLIFFIILELTALVFSFL